MRPLLVAFVLVLVASRSLATARRSTAELVSDPCLLPGFSELLMRAPLKEMEVAAFITEENGAIAFLLWPIMSWFRSQHFRGAVPEQTIAFVHTHPPDSARPSQQDVFEAERLQLPLFVVTHSTIWVVDPHLEPRVRKVASSWTGGVERKPQGCGRMRMAR